MSELVRDDYFYTYMGTAATNQVFSGPCRLIRIVVNTAVDGSINVIDGTSGSTTNVALIATVAADSQAPYYYGIKLNTGLRVIMTGNSDITIVWTKS